MRTVELLVRDADGTATGGEFVEWAVQALVEGLDSPALRTLAGLRDASRFEAKALFDRAANELGLAMPATRDALLRAYLRILAGEIVDGTREPGDALDVIHRDVLGPLNHPSDLMAWCFLWEGHDAARGFESFSGADRDEATRALARQTLNAEGGPP